MKVLMLIDLVVPRCCVQLKLKYTRTYNIMDLPCLVVIKRKQESMYLSSNSWICPVWLHCSIDKNLFNRMILWKNSYVLFYSR